MTFQATSINIITLLLVAFAMWVLQSLSKKDVDSPLPLLFYCGLVAYANFTDREVNTYLFSAGLLTALFLRFEFMNRAFTRIALILEFLLVSGIAAEFLNDVFRLRRTLF
jgi:hypothetical protein